MKKRKELYLNGYSTYWKFDCDQNDQGQITEGACNKN